MKEVRIKINRPEVRRLPKNPKVRGRVLRDAKAIVAVAQILAPKDTGAGAASISDELQPNGDSHISWDQAHDYMRFQELGTEKMPPHPFLRPAGDRFAK